MTDPAPIAVANLSPLQLIQTARAVALSTPTETTAGDAPSSPPRLLFGPSAATLATIDPGLVIQVSGDPGSENGTVAVDLANVAGLAWAAAAEAGDLVAALTVRVKALERQLAEFT